MEQKSNEKYANAKIYKITCNVTGLCYVGSTCLTLSQRLRKHEYNYKYYLEGKTNYVTSFEILENDDYQISLLQSYPCEDNKELLVKEGWYQKKYYDRSVNKNTVGKTIEEKKQEAKQYRQDNKEAIHKKQNIKGKIKITCECGIQYNKSGKTQHLRSNKHKEYMTTESDSE